MKKFILWASLVMLLFTGCNMETQNLEEYVKINLGSSLEKSYNFKMKYNDTDSIDVKLPAYKPEYAIEVQWFKVPYEKFNKSVLEKEVEAIKNNYFPNEEVGFYQTVPLRPELGEVESYNITIGYKY